MILMLELLSLILSTAYQNMFCDRYLCFLIFVFHEIVDFLTKGFGSQTIKITPVRDLIAPSP